MQIEVIAIGDEVLRGAVINSNAAFISRSLFEKGYTITRHTALPDDFEQLEKGLKEALARSCLVICTGGLGPTCDDHTRFIAAKIFHSDFHFDQTIADDLQKRFGSNLVSLQDQATVASKAKVFLNRVGTAPGLVFSDENKVLVLMPGVPPEMKEMFTLDILPHIQKTFSLPQQRYAKQIHFCLLVESMVDPVLRELHIKFPEVEVGIYPAFGALSASLSSSNRAQLEGFFSELTQRFEPYVFQSPNGKIQEAVHEWFIANKKKLALAESCTGGLIAAELTELAGASDYFLGSFVVYSNELKQSLLGVSENTLKNCGAVSGEVVTEMLNGIFERTNADFAIAISGIAGPSGGSLEKPVGTMWAAIGERGKIPDVGTFMAKGNRQTRMLQTANFLLGALWRKLSKGTPSFPFF